MNGLASGMPITHSDDRQFSDRHAPDWVIGILRIQ